MYMPIYFYIYICVCVCIYIYIKYKYNVGYLSLIPGLGRSLGEGNGYPLQYSGLKNSMNCIIHEVAKS